MLAFAYHKIKTETLNSNIMTEENLEHKQAKDNIVQPIVMRSLFCIGYKGFWIVTNFIKLMPYPIRWTYWTTLYYYNKYRFPSGTFTLELYRFYAK